MVAAFYQELEADGSFFIFRWRRGVSCCSSWITPVYQNVQVEAGATKSGRRLQSELYVEVVDGDFSSS